MEVLKIAIAGIAGVLFAVQLKSIRPEYSTYISLATCVILFYYGVSRLSVIVDTLNSIQSYIKISDIYIAVLLKIIGITYIAEFSSALCKDAGYSAVAGQIEVFSKLVILAVSMPVLMALLETIDGLIG
ncbi:MAG: stage III sporulation protein AD [Lachnospiraceae bacterium]|nr:stage III sporulation protein AD [Lachnospiraceae bacterium]